MDVVNRRKRDDYRPRRFLNLKHYLGQNVPLQYIYNHSAPVDSVRSPLCAMPLRINGRNNMVVGSYRCRNRNSID